MTCQCRHRGTTGSPFATSALEGGGWLAPLLGQFIPGKDPVPAAQRLMDLGTSLDKQRKSLPHCDLIPGPSSPQSHCTDYDILPTKK